MLLDNSVVVMEIFIGWFNDPDIAVIQGTTEVWRSASAATLTTVVVFLPFRKLLCGYFGQAYRCIHHFDIASYPWWWP